MFYYFRLCNNANIVIRGFTTQKQKKFSDEMLGSSEDWTWDLWFQVQQTTFWANLACAT